MRKILCMVFAITLLFNYTSLISQPKGDPVGDPVKHSVKDSLQHRNRLFVLPVLFYTPETQLGYGVAGIYTFRFKNAPDTARPSQVQLEIVHSKKNRF